MHQLKHNDAVKCEKKEQWAEVVKLAALNDITLYFIGQFRYCPVLFIENNLDDPEKLEHFSEQYAACYRSYFQINSCSADTLEKLRNFNLLYFKDFCAKIKGEYNDPKS